MRLNGKPKSFSPPVAVPATHDRTRRSDHGDIPRPDRTPVGHAGCRPPIGAWPADCTVGDGRGVRCRPRLRGLAGAGVGGAVAFEGQRFECGRYITAPLPSKPVGCTSSARRARRWGGRSGRGGSEERRAYQLRHDQPIFCHIVTLSGQVRLLKKLK